MLKRGLVFFIIAFILSACTRDELTLQVIRTPLLKFDFDANYWKAEKYFFTGPSAIVAYPANPSLAAVLYNRFSLQASGKDNQGNNLQFNLVFDAADVNQLVGVYRLKYTGEKGLNQVQVYDTGLSLKAYSLNISDSATAFFQILKHSASERLIAGTFQMTLTNNRDTTQKIRIKNGVITDINY